MNELIDMLHREACSCVIAKGSEIVLCHERGVKDLFRILSTDPQLLAGASVADKVVGKGAAALMLLGKVAEVYADVISEPALELLMDAGVSVDYIHCVPNIINRAGTGVCPVEALCRDASTAEECLPLITGFIRKMNNKENN